MLGVVETLKSRKQCVLGKVDPRLFSRVHSTYFPKLPSNISSHASCSFLHDDIPFADTGFSRMSYFTLSQPG